MLVEQSDLQSPWRVREAAQTNREETRQHSLTSTILCSGPRAPVEESAGRFCHGLCHLMKCSKLKRCDSPVRESSIRLSSFKLQKDQHLESPGWDHWRKRLGKMARYSQHVLWAQHQLTGQILVDLTRGTYLEGRQDANRPTPLVVRQGRFSIIQNNFSTLGCKKKAFEGLR